jgi:hypothetical protein
MQDHASGLPLPSAARWNCRVDEELRRELLARRDEDQRIRNLVSSQPGATRVSARNPYWDRWGITIADPDGYRLVLSTLSWP